MYCKKCGKEITNDSVFCNYCGAAQNNTNQATIIVNLLVIDDYMFSVSSFDKAIIDELYGQLVNTNPELKKYVEKSSGEKFGLHDKFFFETMKALRVSEQCVLLIEKYLVLNGFIPTYIRSDRRKEITYIKSSGGGVRVM